MPEESMKDRDIDVVDTLMRNMDVIEVALRHFRRSAAFGGDWSSVEKIDEVTEALKLWKKW